MGKNNCLCRSHQTRTNQAVAHLSLLISPAGKLLACSNQQKSKSKAKCCLCFCFVIFFSTKRSPRILTILSFPTKFTWFILQKIDTFLPPLNRSSQKTFTPLQLSYRVIWERVFARSRNALADATSCAIHHIKTSAARCSSEKEPQAGVSKAQCIYAELSSRTAGKLLFSPKISGSQRQHLPI